MFASLVADMKELDLLLTKLRQRFWTQHKFGDPPDLLAYTFSWGDVFDVVLLWDEDRATGYRTPHDIFNPDCVVYQYIAKPVWVIRAMLSLPPPKSVQAPVLIQQTNDWCRLPKDLPQPVAMRPLRQ